MFWLKWKNQQLKTSASRKVSEHEFKMASSKSVIILCGLQLPMPNVPAAYLRACSAAPYWIKNYIWEAKPQISLKLAGTSTFLLLQSRKIIVSTFRKRSFRKSAFKKQKIFCCSEKAECTVFLLFENKIWIDFDLKKYNSQDSAFKIMEVFSLL